ncbi:MAG: Hsp20/alpha crystallin family protein [Gemmatimonadaceae bacterium]
MVYTSRVTVPAFALRHELGRLLEDTFGGTQLPAPQWTPSADVSETDQELTISIEIPGVSSDNVHLTAEEGVLTISGERTANHKEGVESRHLLVERFHGAFTRRFQLPANVDSEKIVAQYELGMLEIRIPKAAVQRPTEIRITRGGQVAARSENRIESPKKATSTK